MGRRFRVPRVHGHGALPDRDVLYAVLLQEIDHVLDDPGGGYHSPLWEGDGAGPEHDIGLDEGPRPAGKLMKTAAKVNSAANGFHRFLVANHGNSRCGHRQPFPLPALKYPD